MAIASAVVIKYKTRVLIATLPNCETSLICITPVPIEKNTSGTTSICNNLTKPWPNKKNTPSIKTYFLKNPSGTI